MDSLRDPAGIQSMTPMFQKEIADRILAPAEFKDVEAITAAAFGQRRKMLRSALRSLDVDALPLLEAAGIRPDLRAETLSVEEFCALARALKAARAAKAISL